MSGLFIVLEIDFVGLIVFEGIIQKEKLWERITGSRKYCVIVRCNINIKIRP